jgi:hypothetical protein
MGSGQISDPTRLSSNVFTVTGLPYNLMWPLQEAHHFNRLENPKKMPNSFEAFWLLGLAIIRPALCCRRYQMTNIYYVNLF